MNAIRVAGAAALSGLLFGGGLVVSGMADPTQVLAFLVLGPGWSPALLVVMASAVAVAAAGFQLARRRAQPWFAPRFELPSATQLDGPLIGGAVLFGVGWGLAGYCPGPAFVAAALLDERALVFLAGFLGGAGLFALQRRWRAEARSLATDG